MDKQFYTYLHCTPNGEPFYIGKGCGGTDRNKRSHNFNARNSHHKNIVAKYGIENIGIFIFPCDSEQQAFNDEIQQIAKLRQEGYELCNQTNGGEGVSGIIRSAATRAKIGIAHKGKVVSKETREKLSLAAKQRINLNKQNRIKRICSEETKHKMSITRKLFWIEKNKFDNQSKSKSEIYMIKKADLIKYLGGTAMNAACRLGYDTIRPDNNITRLPEVLTKRQAGVIIMRMKAKRITVPAEWQKE